MHTIRWIGSFPAAVALIGGAGLGAACVSSAWGTPPLTLEQSLEWEYGHGKGEAARNAWVADARRAPEYLPKSLSGPSKLDGIQERLLGVQYSPMRAPADWARHYWSCVRVLLECETKYLKTPEDAPVRLEIATAGRGAAVAALKIMQDHKAANAEEQYLLERARYDVARLVDLELTLLKDAGQTAAADALAKQYADLLPYKEIDIRSELFWRQYGSRGGPFRFADAYYRRGMIQEAREEFLRVVEDVKDTVMELAKQDPEDPQVVQLIRQMRDFTGFLSRWERMRTGPRPRDQYFPEEALPLVRKGLECARQAFAALEANPSVDRNSRVYRDARSEVNGLGLDEQRLAEEIQRRKEHPAPPLVLPAGAGEEWRRAEVLTLRQVQACLLVEDFFTALMQEDLKRLDDILDTRAQSSLALLDAMRGGEAWRARQRLRHHEEQRHQTRAGRPAGIGPCQRGPLHLSGGRASAGLSERGERQAEAVR